MEETAVLYVDGISCKHCVSVITKSLNSLEGVSGTIVNLVGKTVTVKHISDVCSFEKICDEINDLGYEVII